MPFLFTLVKILFVFCILFGEKNPVIIYWPINSQDFIKKNMIFGLISEVIVQYESGFMLFYFLTDIQVMMKLLQDEKTASKELWQLQ